jgi:hypothetical protein
VITIPEHTIAYLPRVSGYAGNTCLHSWGMQTTTNTTYLEQDWGSTASPYCNEADNFLLTAAGHLLGEVGHYQPPFLEVTPEPVRVFDPRDGSEWETTALVKAHKIPSCFVKHPQTGTVYLGSPRIVARTIKGNRPVFFKQFLEPEKAQSRCPIPYVIPLIALIREAETPVQQPGLFDGLMAAADALLANPPGALTIFPGWQLLAPVTIDTPRAEC